MKTENKNVELAARRKYVPQWSAELVSNFLDLFSLMCLRNENCADCPMFHMKCNPFNDKVYFDFEIAWEAVIDFIRNTKYEVLFCIFTLVRGWCGVSFAPSHFKGSYFDAKAVTF